MTVAVGQEVILVDGEDVVKLLGDRDLLVVWGLVSPNVANDFRLQRKAATSENKSRVLLTTCCSID